MNRRLALIALVVTMLLAGCRAQSGDYLAASSISRNGFGTDAEKIGELVGREVKLWGFVDHGNLYGDAGTQAILQDWWSGNGPSATSWRFNLKANADDEVGQSFEVRVPNDAGRDELLRRFVGDATTGKPTKVFVKGKLSTFDAPTNAGQLTGLAMDVQSSTDVLLDLPEAKR